MKIAILGTRGIPNLYGGFEQNAENLSKWWTDLGHDVTVYNPDYHPYKSTTWKGVKIKHIFSNEDKIGMIGNFLYDYFSLKDAVKQDFDIILNMGYVPSALFFKLRKKTRAKFITNMDGIEWKRSKWNNILKTFIKYCEKIAIDENDYLIADHPEILKYYKTKYNVSNITYIAYGADLFESPKEKFLEKFNLNPYKYFMLVARLEPENNIEIILDGYIMSNVSEPFIVIGGLKTKYAKYLLNKYKNHKNIKFVGGIYNYDEISSLRWFAKIYFHGHSVGGTNPSLLEAMASSAYIAAHNNPFNVYILENNAFYFKDKIDVKALIKNFKGECRQIFTKNNRVKIAKIYNWKKISKQYLELFEEVVNT